MINNLQLLKFNSENASTKHKIVSALSNEWPLTAKQIYNRLQKEYETKISYQGVHKIIKEMETNKFLERKKEGYQINLEWIQSSKKSLELLEKHYLQNGKIKLPSEFHGSIEIEFDNFTDLCISTTELLMSRQLVPNSSQPDFICSLEYGWWPLKFRFEHFVLLQNMMKSNPKSKGIIRTKTLFGQWIKEQYNRIAAVCAPLGTKVDINEDIFIQGDCIIEVTFNNESKKIFEQYYGKWKNMEDVFMEFGLKSEPKIRAVMRITKNMDMAQFMRKQLEKVFEKGKKSQ